METVVSRELCEDRIQKGLKNTNANALSKIKAFNIKELREEFNDDKIKAAQKTRPKIRLAFRGATNIKNGKIK